MSALVLGAGVVVLIRHAMLAKRIEILERRVAERRVLEAAVLQPVLEPPPAAAPPPSALRPPPSALRPPPPPPAPAPPAPAPDRWRAFELRAGTRWITWIGATALVIGA